MKRKPIFKYRKGDMLDLSKTWYNGEEYELNVNRKDGVTYPLGICELISLDGMYANLQTHLGDVIKLLNQVECYEKKKA